MRVGFVLALSFITITTEATFRLVDRQRNNIIAGGQEGLLLYNGGTVCDDHFNITAAHAVCNILGFEGALTFSSGQRWSIQTTHSVLLDDVMCRLPDWYSCRYSHTVNCGHSEDVFLTCSSRSGSIFQLVDASGNYITRGEQEGLLLHNGGTVGGIGLTSSTSHAICRVLGYNGHVKWTSGQKWQIQSTFPMSINNVKCSHPDWSFCNYTTLQDHTHGTDVFLTCSGDRSPFSLVDKRGYTVSGTQKYLLLYNGGTVCADEFSNNSADAACRHMGYSGAESWQVGSSWGTHRIALDDLNCTAGDFSFCSFTTSHNCVQGNDVFISCKTAEDSKNLPRQETRDINLEETRDKTEAHQQAGENLAITVLTLACSVLVFLLVKKNSQIDQKDQQIAELLTKYDKILNRINYFEGRDIKSIEKISHSDEIVNKKETETLLK